MTVRKPMQSPTNSRSKVATPWPIAKDYSKPLPDTPFGFLPHHDSYKPATPPKDEGKEYSISPEKSRSNTLHESGERSPRSLRRHESTSRIGDARLDGPVIDTPKSSSESQRSLPKVQEATTLANPEYRQPYHQPSSITNNPFRRKEVGGGQTNEQEAAGGLSEILQPIRTQKETDRPDTGDSNSASIPEKAPQLDISDADQSPIDFSGFSGGYFSDLQELQQSKLNAANIKDYSHGSNEKISASNINLPNAYSHPTTSLDSTYAFSQHQKNIPQPSNDPNVGTALHLPPTSHDMSGPFAPPVSPAQPAVPVERGPIPPNPPHIYNNNTTEHPDHPPPSHQRSTTQSSNVTAPQNRSTDSPRPRKSSETYQIRLVNWFDSNSPENPRRSPIMVQNANGPCPLLALVNALVLSTPFGLATALVETLRVREQVSLGLLLDAVIDELMSGRRGNAAQNLPDVSDLYGFLLNLHTGMNVNPRFVPLDAPLASLIDAPIDGYLATDARQPGGFENTREMKLYSTFAVPLIHGWVPPRTHPAFESLKRTAKTYEDAQNILFREEELEGKLKSEGLGSEEQVLLQDIASIKYFLSSTATQLTGYGLDSINESLSPGSISILFRNDHFSTLYKDPKTGRLLTLVTDMGYAGHDEVVWESLVDVSGEGCEFFAGDFRPVGNVVETTEHTGVDEEGWQTVTRRPHKATQISQSGNEGPTQTSPSAQRPDQQPRAPTSTEQEDHDLALAMQLQEEEEERHRRDAAARRREDELSKRYLSNSDPATGRRTFPGFGRGARGGGHAPQVPPRGGRSGRQAPPVTRRRESGEEAPPSYEQASKGEPYHPPPNHPAHPSSSPGPTVTTPNRPAGLRNRTSSSAYAEQAGLSPGHRPGGSGGGAPPTSLNNAPWPSSSGNNTGGGKPSLPRRPKGRSSWGPNLENAPGIVRRTGTQQSDLGGEERKEDGKKEKDCIVM